MHEILCRRLVDDFYGCYSWSNKQSQLFASAFPDGVGNLCGSPTFVSFMPCHLRVKHHIARDRCHMLGLSKSLRSAHFERIVAHIPDCPVCSNNLALIVDGKRGSCSYLCAGVEGEWHDPVTSLAVPSGCQVTFSHCKGKATTCDECESRRHAMTEAPPMQTHMRIKRRRIKSPDCPSNCRW